MPIEYYPYQKEDMPLIDKFGGRVLLSYEMGLGKTPTSLGWAMSRPDTRPILVVCPASVKYNWDHEARRFFDLRASMCEGRDAPARVHHGFEVPPDLTIINYDVLKDWTDYLRQRRFGTVIFDEGQYLSNANSLRRKAAKKVAQRIPHCLILSGTPFMNKPIDLWSLLNILWPDEYPSEWSFAQRFCNPKWTPWGWNLSGGTNLDELNRELLAQGMIRRRKKDVLKDLPDKVFRIVPCDISDREQYNFASNDFLGWLGKYANHKVEKASKAEKVTRIGSLLRLTAKMKLQAQMEWANRFLAETDEKLVIFAVHTKAIEAIQRNLNTQVVVINGEVPTKKRHPLVQQFNDDPATRAFVGNYIAAGTGINLQAASEIGLFEFPWRPGDVLQAVDRLHRIGQKKTVFVNFLVAGGTIEEDVVNLHHLKQARISTVLDGGSDGSDIDLYDELLRVLEGRLI